MSDIVFSGPSAMDGRSARRISDFTVSDAARTDWRPAPINPAWILSGDPVAQYIPVEQGADGYSSMSLWKCSEGRFRWTFDWEESVYILDGEVEIASPDGRIAHLRPGSVALFQAGTSSIWTVIRPVQKLAVCRRAISPRLSKLLRFVRRPWSLPILAAGLIDRLAIFEPAFI